MFPIHGFLKVFFAIYFLVLASLLIISVFVLYPLIEYINGHFYPRIPLFGVAPCPTIIFSLALLIGSIPKVDRKIFILLILPVISYSFIVSIILGVWADSLLLVPGIYGLITLIKNWKLIEK